MAALKQFFTIRKEVSVTNQLRPVQFYLLLMAVFTVFNGYGIVLPVLPFLLENRFGLQESSVAWHTGMMTAVFMFALFLFAPLWGKLSDRIGRRPVILIGLGGCTIALMAFGIVDSLLFGYLTRALGGAAVSAVLPVALAYISDNSNGESRAQRFAWVSAAATLGFLIGPALGGWLASDTLATTSTRVESTSLPFLVGAIGGSLVWLFVYMGLSELPVKSAKLPMEPDKSAIDTGPISRLLLLAMLGMFGLGSFEVSMALQGQQILNLNPFQIGMLFVECSLMMILVQIWLFAPLVRHFSFMPIVICALLMMAIGLGLFPLTKHMVVVIFAVGLVGFGSGILIPVLAYQASIIAGIKQGATLGKQNAAGSLGQGLGSALAGILFGMLNQAPFWLTAGLLTTGALLGIKFGKQRSK